MLKGETYWLRYNSKFLRLIRSFTLLLCIVAWRPDLHKVRSLFLYRLRYKNSQ
ncbi:MAG: hypothetical protein LBJ00_13600 [Planctomycetaceae bacterium]|nr:hypothetical protein [Planctomycetaceae bacterium]